jgi:hypothetical protein
LAKSFLSKYVVILDDILSDLEITEATGCGWDDLASVLGRSWKLLSADRSRWAKASNTIHTGRHSNESVILTIRLLSKTKLNSMV